MSAYIAVFARRLREGKTYEDFVDAWYPDQGFGVDVRGPFTGRSTVDERDILTVAFVDIPDGVAIEDAMERVGAQESLRHERIDEVIESTALRGLYQQLDAFDFSSDQSVAAQRPS